MGGRGKAGAVKIVKSEREYKEAVDTIFNLRIKGSLPEYVLIEEFVLHEKEYYLSILVSKPDKSVTILASPFGGVEVEELARREGALIKLDIDPVIGVSSHHLRLISKFLAKKLDKNLMSLVRNLYNAVVKEDLLLAEINPLAVVEEGYVALDSKVILDDNSEFRHDLEKYFEYKKFLTWGEKMAREYGFSYVPLSGDVAIIGNGAGLTMATLDLVAYYGSKPACFLDVGGGASSERIAKALEVVMKELNPKKVFINIFAGITRCDEVAKGIVKAVDELNLSKDKFVIRLTGTLEDVGKEILEGKGFKVYIDMDEAAQEAARGV
jgi:succinyl-CoA synthetase beta subunit